MHVQNPKNLMRYLIIVLVLLFFTFGKVSAQDETTPNSKPKKHAIALVISHTQINEGLDENGEKQWLSLPSWGINYNYYLNKKWALGIHSDIIVEDFVVESLGRSGETIERSYPIASALVVSYKPGEHFSFMLGTGGEFTKDQSFFMLRLGIEYSYHMNQNWELIANLLNDLKLNGYNSWGVGLGVAYRL